MRLNRASVAVGVFLAVAAIAVAADITHTLTADFTGASGTAANVAVIGDELSLTSVSATTTNVGATYNWYRSTTDFSTAAYQLELEKDDATVFDIVDVCLDNTVTTLSDGVQVTVNGRSYRGGAFVGGGNE
ncbi:MAG: hypothetical protein GWP91_21375, partial [Rhodobacterales bacterium]|nr:hypothetical protein [Rhodobacterales bacterium]